MTKKRKHPRVSFSALTHILLSEEETMVQAYPFSAGHGGLGLYTIRPIPLGQEVVSRVLLNMGNGKSAIEAMQAVVRWCDTLGNMYRVGLEFCSVDDQEHATFYAHLKESEQWN